MLENSIKKWTILIYANGNNEMEPEMYHSLKAGERIGSNGSVNVVMEIGRISQKLVSIARGTDVKYSGDEKWTGTRRYYVKSPQSELVEDLGCINMADPRKLYEFIKWGTTNFKAEHYMLVLGGHGIFFVGMMTDFSEGIAYMMGTPEMCNAINRAGIPIDILVMDMCYMNSIELIYELGKEKNSVVNTMLTYIGEGPYEGLPYDRLISIVMNEDSLKNIKGFSKHIIDELNNNLISYEINNYKLNKIKKGFSRLAYDYLKNREIWKVDVGELLISDHGEKPWHKHLVRIERELNSIILHYDEHYDKNGSLIKIMLEELHNLSLIYCKLSFSMDNYWTNLVLDRDISSYINFKIRIEQKPMRIPGIDLTSYILSLNPSLTREEAELILKKISRS